MLGTDDPQGATVGTPPSDTVSDWVLAGRVAAGDDRAFGLLMDRHRQPVLRFVSRMLGDAGEAEDIAQGVFVRAYRSLHVPAFPRQDAQFSTWLFRIARNAALDALRYRASHPAESLAALEERGGAVAGGTRSAAAELVDKEIGTAVAAAVASLPEDQRAALVLREYEGLPQAEIAAVLKCSVRSVEARLFRARQYLRRRLAHLL